MAQAETRECGECGQSIVKPPGRGRPPTKCVDCGGTGELAGRKRKPTAKRTTVRETAPPRKSSTSKKRNPPPPVDEDEYEWEDEEEDSDDEYEEEDYEEEDEDESEEDEPDRFGEVSKRVEISTGFAASQKKANATAKYLAEQGWTGTRVKLPEQGRVELTATRDIEMLTAVWVNGELVQPMDYTMWATDSTDPYSGKHDLPFDPAEAGDSEIVKSINGRTIEWYNALSQQTEVATVNNGSVRIQHLYDPNGDENLLERQITFNSRESGTRTIRLEGLRRIGGSTRRQRSDAGQTKPRKTTAQKATPVEKAMARRTLVKRTGKPARKSR